MKLLILALCVVLSLQLATSCNDRALGISVLGVEDEIDVLDIPKDCHAKDLCALQCSCGKVAYFDLAGSKYAQKYDQVCNRPKVEKAKVDILTKIKVEITKIMSRLGQLKKAMKKKKLFGRFRGKKKRRRAAAESKVRKVEFNDGKNLRPIMIEFAEHVKHLCESGALGKHTPAQQQKQLWEKFINGKKVPKTEYVRNLAQDILDKTVNIFAARCNCADIAPEAKELGVAQCNKVCGGQYGVEEKLFRDTTKIPHGIAKKSDKNIDQVNEVRPIKEIIAKVEEKVEKVKAKNSKPRKSRSGKKGVCIKTGKKKSVCITEDSNTINIRFQ